MKEGVEGNSMIRNSHRLPKYSAYTPCKSTNPHQLVGLSPAQERRPGGQDCPVGWEYDVVLSRVKTYSRVAFTRLGTKDNKSLSCYFYPGSYTINERIFPRVIVPLFTPLISSQNERPPVPKPSSHTLYGGLQSRRQRLQNLDRRPSQILDHSTWYI